jgi:hypothetical protein
MSIVSLDECLEFLGIETTCFIITPSNNTLNVTSSSGGPVDINLSDGNYDGNGLATEIQTKMNANLTLTGTGVITFLVSYSPTTRKFSIGSGTGKTIAYNHTLSDAGLTVGFTASKTATQTITSDIETGDPSQVVSTIKDAAEEIVSKYCGRTFEETSYSKSKHDGNGSPILNIDNFPVTAIDRVTIGEIDVVSVRNTNTYSYASVSVLPTGLRLVLDGVADTSITFASNTTLNAVVSAINLLGNGWEAKLNSSIYVAVKSTELIEAYGLNAIDNNWCYLKKPDSPISDFDTYLDRGQLVKYSGWPSGTGNIYIDYTAGYSSANMPSDLKLAVKILVQFLYNKRDDDSFGLKEYRAHNIWATFDKEESLPKEVMRILFKYRKVKV